MIVTRQLSAESKELIKESREVALDLGDDFISTIHLFFADCRLNKPTTIKFFAFDNDDEFKTYYDKYKSPNPIALHPDDELLLTKEAETALHNSAIQSYLYNDQFIQPWHIFIAVLKTPGSLLAETFSTEANALDKLLEYYQELGSISLKKNSGVFKRLLEKYPSIFSNLVRFVPK